MTLSNARAFHGLTAQGTNTKTLVDGSATIGSPQAITTYPSADVAYAVSGTLTSVSATFVLTPTTGEVSCTPLVAGRPQIETAAAAGTVTIAGNATVAVSATGFNGGSVLTIPFAVAGSDTPALWAPKAVAAMNLSATYASFFTATVATTAIITTRNTDTNGYYQADIADLNIALATGTATGITAAPTSAATQTGIATSGTSADNDMTDFEGIDLPASMAVDAVKIDIVTGSAYGTWGTGTFPLPALFHAVPAGMAGNIVVTATSAATLAKITVIATGD